MAEITIVTLWQFNSLQLKSDFPVRYVSLQEGNLDLSKDDGSIL